MLSCLKVEALAKCESRKLDGMTSVMPFFVMVYDR